MPTDLEQQLARFAAVLDRDAPTISFDDVLGRGTVAVDVDLLEGSSSDRAARVDGVSWIDAAPSADAIGERAGLIELAPALVVRRPAWRRVSLKVGVAVAAVAVLVVTLASIERGGDELDLADDFPSLTTTFVSPRNGFSVKHPDTAAVTPAIATEDGVNGEDVVETGSAAVFTGTSTKYEVADQCFDSDSEPIPCGSVDEQIDRHVSDGSCGVPRSQQAEIIIDGHYGRVAACPNRIEATVLFAGRLYLFTLSHDRSDARAVFDAFVETIGLTPETAADFPALTETFVSPTYGYSFGYIRGLTPATERWDPANQPVADKSFDGRFDAVETGYGAYLEGASTPIPDGISIDDWVDQYVTPLAAGGCGVPRSQQAEITIDGRSGRFAECQDQIDATVVAGGRLYLFILYRSSHDARAMLDAWIATMDLTPETAT